jgi:hypothetical protein
MEPFLQFPKLVYSALTQDLIPALRNFCPLMITLFRRVFCPERGGVRRQTCTHVAHPAFKRAGPMIYDQYCLMSLGLAVSCQDPTGSQRSDSDPV